MAFRVSDKQTFAFQAEIAQMISLIRNTIVHNKEIFLREILSNAGKALNEIRFKALNNASQLDSGKELQVRIMLDRQARTLTLVDTGVGITKDKMISHLGTNGKSGTKAFMEALLAGADVSLIGQCDVGFYSVFLVADRVTVISKSNEQNTKNIWESSGEGCFSVGTEVGDERLDRGTKVVLHLREDRMEFLDNVRIRQLVKKYSSCICYPIFLARGAGMSRIHTETPLWTRDPATITQAEYAAFYKSVTDDWEQPFSVKHCSVVRPLNFTTMLFIPKTLPFDLFENMTRRRKIAVHAKRTLITDSTDDHLPEYLSFFRGIVDSPDLPITLMRDTMRNDNIMKAIKKNLIKKCLEHIEEISEDSELYAKFLKQYGKNIKLGIHEDAQNRTKLAGLLRYFTSSSGSEQCSLKDYVARMPKEQTHIYYVTGETVAELVHSPFVERIRQKRLEVVYMVDPIDEYTVQQLKEFDGKPLASLSKVNLEIPENEEEKKEHEANKLKFEGLCKSIKGILGKGVETVTVSNRLVTSPCVIVTSRYGWTANMERIMKIQAFKDNCEWGYMSAKKHLEINPSNPIIESLLQKNDIKDVVTLMYTTAQLASGFSLDKPKNYISQVRSMARDRLGLEKEELMEGLEKEEIPRLEEKDEDWEDSPMDVSQ